MYQSSVILANDQIDGWSPLDLEIHLAMAREDNPFHEPDQCEVCESRKGQLLGRRGRCNRGTARGSRAEIRLELGSEQLLDDDQREIYRNATASAGKIYNEACARAFARAWSREV